MLNEKFYYIGLTKIVKEVVNSCDVCCRDQRKKKMIQVIKPFSPEINDFSVDLSFFCGVIFFHLMHLVQ